MEIVEELKNIIVEAFQKCGVAINKNDVVIENSKDPSHGDYATNAAMKFSRMLNKSPRDVASMICESISSPLIKKVEVAGPGFINFYVNSNSLSRIISKIINDKDNFGRGSKKNKKVNIEFVSANPTGDLHVGHARGAAIGDSLCRIFEFSGYDVTREYYINDAGNQIDNLAYSLEARYKQLLGLPFQIPEDGYHGEDIISIAKNLLESEGNKLLEKENHIAYFKKRGMELELDKIKKDLDLYRVHFDVFSSELAIRSNSAVEKELDYLKQYVYQQDGATLLKTSAFLDDKDRVIVKSNGDYTYFLPDIVYHVNKLSRGFDRLIDILGADHHGYINRMKSALMMHGYSKDVLDIELNQMVRIMQGGKEIVCSKRTGNAYTLRELCEDAGVDAARYFFAMRAASNHLDFDLDLAREKSNLNPVYYAQYAHARLCSILLAGKEIGADTKGNDLIEPSEIALLKHLVNFPEVVEISCMEKAPYKIANYIHALAELIHSFYTNCRVIDQNNIPLSQSRLGLCLAAKIVLKNALFLIGVNAPEHM